MKFLKKFFINKRKINTTDSHKNSDSFDIELTSLLLAFEVARSDGEVSEDEELFIKNKINEKGLELSLFKDIKDYSEQNVSFYELIKSINANCSHEDKLSIIKNLWGIAFADGSLITHEERIIRRVADMINIKDVKVLKLKHDSQTNS